MKRFRIFVSLAVAAALCTISLVARRADAITFGEPDTENRFSNVGAIVVTADPSNLQIAGSGILIHPRVLLTAGHVTKSGEELLAQGVPLFDISRISFGADAFDPSTWVESVAIMTHPGFLSDRNPNGSPPDFPDIGVIILKEPVDLPCATLGYEGLLDDLKDCGWLTDPQTSQFVSVGYGATLVFPPPQEVHPDGLRRFSYPEFVGLTPTEVHLNQNPAAGNSGIATGDSGGPLFWVAPSGELIVVAIHRAADHERTSMEFAYRTDVPQTLDFIDTVIAMVEAGAFD